MQIICEKLYDFLKSIAPPTFPLKKDRSAERFTLFFPPNSFFEVIEIFVCDDIIIVTNSVVALRNTYDEWMSFFYPALSKYASERTRNALAAKQDIINAPKSKIPKDAPSIVKVHAIPARL